MLQQGLSNISPHCETFSDFIKCLTGHSALCDDFDARQFCITSVTLIREHLNQMMIVSHNYLCNWYSA